MKGFVDHVDSGRSAHLVLAGPGVTSVADDPEARAVLNECLVQWRDLPAATRARITLACLPMHDADENAAIVNALQRHASVVCQKSLAEGYGLTVAEALFKARPVVASGIGGIRDQILDGKTGILLDDPTDLRAVGRSAASSTTLARASRGRRGPTPHHRGASDRHLVGALARGDAQRARRVITPIPGASAVGRRVPAGLAGGGRVSRGAPAPSSPAHRPA